MKKKINRVKILFAQVYELCDMINNIIIVYVFIYIYVTLAI